MPLGITPLHSYDDILLHLKFSIQIIWELLPNGPVIWIELDEFELKLFG